MSSQSNRRTFLKQAGTSLAAASLLPGIVRGANKSGTEPVIIGEGDFQYECQHGWGQVPEQIRWKNTHGSTIDKDGLIYISHQGDANNPCDIVVVFDAEGRYVRSFGKEFSGGGHGIDLRNEGGTEYLYLSVTAPHRVIVKCDTKGNVVWKNSAPMEAGVYDDKHLFNPTNVCFGPNGELFAGDGYGSSYLHQYDKDGKWVRTWGGTGKLAGQLRTPHGQWLDLRNPERPLLAVADRANSRLQFFTLDGQSADIVQGVPEAKISENGAKSEQATADGSKVPVTSLYGISSPSSVDSRGEYLIVADLHARVSIFNGKNELVANLGFDEPWTALVLNGGKLKMRSDPSTWKAGKFVHPHDATFDPAGNIYVTEWVDQGRITFLRKV